MTITSMWRTAAAGALVGAIGLLAPGPALAGIVFGGTGKSDCYAAINVDGIDANSSRVQKNKKVLCTDGEACDTGACGDGVCNMRVAACINQPGLSRCTPPAGLQRFKVKGKLNIGVPQALEGSACGSFLDVTVATKKTKKKVKPGKAKFKVQAKALKGTKPATDNDTFELQCLPRTVECPPPTTTTTTTTTSTTQITIPPVVCGDGMLGEGEPCDGDLGSCAGGATCNVDCTCPSDFALDFTVVSQAGNCGRIENGSGAKIADLGCGGLNIGSGNAAAPAEGPTPDGSTNRFGLAGCASDVCQIQQSSFDAAAEANGIDCTAPGCPFGIPLPIEGSPTTCVLNSFATPATGTFNIAAGTTEDLNVNLSSLIYGGGSYLTSNGTTDVPKPCPVCVNSINFDLFPAGSFLPVSGTPAAPATGVCNGGPRAGQPCTTRNSQGLTHDCQPGGDAFVGGNVVQPPRPCEQNEDCRDSLNQLSNNIGSIPVNLSPLKTSTVTVTKADGLFCPDQPANGAGCFGAEVGEQGANGGDCRSIVSIGSPFGDLTGGQAKPGVLASVFCIPRTNSIVDLAANLPGPGQVTLPGNMTLVPLTGSSSGAFLD